MTNILENFRKYHTANYHDGDSTFDQSVYRKSNGEDFDSEFVQDCYDHYVAGVEILQEENRRVRAVNINLHQGQEMLEEKIEELVDLVKTPADSEMYLFEELQKEQEHSKQLQQKLDNILRTAVWHIEDCACHHPISKRQLGWLEAMSLIKDLINTEEKK